MQTNSPSTARANYHRILLGRISTIAARMIRATVIIAVTLFVPVIGHPDLLLHPKLITLSFIGYVLLLSQHDLKKSDAEAQAETDRGSVLAILIAAVLSQVIPVVEWGYFNHDQWGNPIVSFVGLMMASTGLALRIWSIRTMGACFSVTVQIMPGHRVIKHGPFAIVRHPCYLGAILTLIGCDLPKCADWSSVGVDHYDSCIRNQTANGRENSA